MVGGTIIDIKRKDKKIYILVEDYLDRQWRSLDYSDKTICISIGERIWWQIYEAYWSCGLTVDIKIGKCYPACNPSKIK